MRIIPTVERWPLREPFRIARGSRTAAEVVVVTVESDGATGRGECTPYRRYGETAEGVVKVIEGVARERPDGLEREELPALLPASAARNALDCALWDLEARKSGRPVWSLAGLSEPGPVITAFTLGLNAPAEVEAAARRAADRPLLKLKLGADQDLERVRAARNAAPGTKLIVDANEGWTLEILESLAGPLAELGVDLIEQPLPADQDQALSGIDLPIPLCADESCHDRTTLPGLEERYDAVNVKLDKAGGLSEALATTRGARASGLDLMVGCMVGTSLAMAPAVLLAQDARWVDLDGPLLLGRDRSPALRYEEGRVHPPEPALWG